ncbi:hypothetical protein CIHG_10408 [Coccidioides immitis H538.4]|uniref:Uncharacterized protein n=1 Tax=Coccidioides immitis H538.4 TaxID=396776 RepID=A0A0J8UXD5_COCIT|nr:hypothetical protein CIHG_10408 [Coccidioides immitis H538.4]
MTTRTCHSSESSVLRWEGLSRGYEFGMHIHEVRNQLSPSRRQLICYTIRSVLWPLRRPLILLFVLETDYLELCNWMHSHMATSFAAYSVADLARYPPREMAWRVGRCLHAYMHGLDIGQGCRNTLAGTGTHSPTKSESQSRGSRDKGLLCEVNLKVGCGLDFKLPMDSSLGKARMRRKHTSKSTTTCTRTHIHVEYTLQSNQLYDKRRRRSALRLMLPNTGHISHRIPKCCYYVQSWS